MSSMNKNTKIGLYIHIPFCEKKCHYCDFLTFTNKNEEIENYINYLLKEIDLYKNNEYFLDTIYIGGGTPSYISEKYIERVLNKIKSNFKISENAEITIEMNPESVSKKKIISYLKNGINRFSMGVQTFDNEVLKIMGRLHTKEKVLNEINLMKSLGCKNISIDLMLANPKQSMDILEKDLDIALNLDINHISYYSLILKEHTHFELWEKQGKIELWDPEEEREMYHKVTNKLKNNGFLQYEISSFSKPGFESIHNQKYWKLQDFIGIGMGASSNLGLKRYTNTRKFNIYYKMINNNKLPIAEIENLDLEIREKEFIILNLRMTRGFSINEINKRFNIDFLEKYKNLIDKYLNENILSIDNEYVHFTDKGIDNGNLFFIDLYEFNL